MIMAGDHHEFQASGNWWESSGASATTNNNNMNSSSSVFFHDDSSHKLIPPSSDSLIMGLGLSSHHSTNWINPQPNNFLAEKSCDDECFFRPMFQENNLNSGSTANNFQWREKLLFSPSESSWTTTTTTTTISDHHQFKQGSQQTTQFSPHYNNNTSCDHHTTVTTTTTSQGLLLSEEVCLFENNNINNVISGTTMMTSTTSNFPYSSSSSSSNNSITNNNHHFTNNGATIWNNASQPPFSTIFPSSLQPAFSTPNFNMQSKNISGSRESKKSGGSEVAPKRPRNETSSPLPAFKVRKEKMGDRITALQQLVSPFGKTDTASVLSEAIEYIKFLHEQVTVLSTPYMKSGAPIIQHQQISGKSKESQDLRSRGLCLVPVSSTFPVTHETPVDFWMPTFGATLR